jgi:hypothetical protein
MPDVLPTAILDSTFVFRKRPIAVDPDLRPLRRVTMLLFLIDACRGGMANHEQLHVLDWAVRTPTTRSTLIEFLTGQRSPETAIVRFDPTLDRAVSLAVGAKLLAVIAKEAQTASVPDYRVELTTEGSAALSEVDSTLFEVERAFLKALPRKLTQSDVRDLFTWGLRP